MARKLIVEIVGDASSLERAYGRAEAKSKTFGSSVSRLGKTAAITAGAAGFGSLIVAVKRGFDEFTESQQVAAQTRAVLKSTGAVAGVTAKHVDQLASAISQMSGIDDEAIAATENLILGFTHIRNEAGKGRDVFDRLTRVVIDYSVRTGKDARGAAILFGKALNEIAQGQIPKSIRGVGKLSAALQEEIKAHVKAGDVTGAQAALLGKLEKSYGGAAKAAGSTLTGSLHKLRESFDEVASIIVAAMAPALERLADRTAKWLSKAENQEKVQRAVESTMRVLTAAVKVLKQVIEAISPVIKTVVDLLGGWRNALLLLIALKFASVVVGWSRALTGFKTSAAGATLSSKLLLANLSRLAAIGVITIGIEILLHKNQIDQAVTSFLRKHKLGFLTGKTIKNWSDWENAPDWAKAQLLAEGFDPASLPGAPKPAGSRRTASPTPPRAKRGRAGRINAAAPSVAPSLGLPAAAAPTTSMSAISIASVVLPGVTNPREFLRELQTISRQSAPSRAGRFGGHNLGLT